MKSSSSKTSSKTASKAASKTASKAASTIATTSLKVPASNGFCWSQHTPLFGAVFVILIGIAVLYAVRSSSNKGSGGFLGRSGTNTANADGFSADVDPKGHNFLCTKTTYMNARNENRAKFLTFDRFLAEGGIPDGCTAVHLTFLIRHAVRHPKKSEMHTFETLLSAIRDKIVSSSNFKGSQKVRDEIAKWTYSYDPEKENAIWLSTASGLMETETIAYIFQSYFPEIFNTNETKYSSVASNQTRTIETGRTFQGALLLANGYTFKAVTHAGHDEELASIFPMQINNTISSVSYGVKHNKRGPTLKQLGESERAQNLVVELAAHLGLPSDGLTFDDVHNMYLYCGYVAAELGYTPWCELFNREQLRLMEYMVDVHGYFVNYLGLACYSGPMVMAEFANIIDAAVKENSQTDGVVKSSSMYFSHSSLFKPLITYLGLYPSLPNTTVIPENLERDWHGGNAVPFNANFAFVLYRCTSGGNVSFKILILYNEIPVVIPGCTEKLCDYTEFAAKYKDIKPGDPMRD